MGKPLMKNWVAPDGTEYEVCDPVARENIHNLVMGVAEVTEDGSLVINVLEGTAIKTGTQICYRDPSVIENARAEIASNYATISGKQYLFVTADNRNIDAKELHEKNDTIIIRIDETLSNPHFAQVIAVVPKEQESSSGECCYVANPPTNQEDRLGEELIAADGSGWTLDGWTGDLANGFTHTVGSDGKLTYAIGDTGEKTYFLKFYVSSADGAGAPGGSTAFTVTLGGSPRVITYKGGGSGWYTFGIKSVEDGNLEFIPCDPADPYDDANSFNGTITNISLKEILDYSAPMLVLKDKDDNVLEEKRLMEESTYTGINSGRNALEGADRNTAFGNNALRENTTGYWNTAVGSTAMRDNTVGSRNVAIGHRALEEGVSGDRNVAIGTFALMRNIAGRCNVAIGADSLWCNKTGSRNIALGLAALAENVTGCGNIGIGQSTNSTAQHGNHNVAIGDYALSQSDGNYNIGIGYRTLVKTAKETDDAEARFNVAIGHVALQENKTGSDNVAIGAQAMKGRAETADHPEYKMTARSNIAIGNNALQNATSAYYNVCIGGASAGNMMSAYQNTVIGNQAGSSIVTKANNVVVGFKADAGKSDAEAQNATAVGANSKAIANNSSVFGCNSKAEGIGAVAVGYAAQANYMNSLALGYQAQTTKSNSVVIGNDSITETLVKGNLVVRGTDGVKRQIVFNADNTCSWTEVAA